MGTMKLWIENRRAKKVMSMLRKRQIEKVNSQMKKVYNPIYFRTKPKYRKKVTVDELISVSEGVKKVYNPPIKKDYNEMIDIEEWDLAET